jgi:hypothetical protein
MQEQIVRCLPLMSFRSFIRISRYVPFLLTNIFRTYVDNPLLKHLYTPTPSLLSLLRNLISRLVLIYGIDTAVQVSSPSIKCIRRRLGKYQLVRVSQVVSTAGKKRTNNEESWADFAQGKRMTQIVTPTFIHI